MCEKEVTFLIQDSQKNIVTNFLKPCFVLFYCLSKSRLFFTLGYINGTKIKRWVSCFYFKLKQ